MPEACCGDPMDMAAIQYQIGLCEQAGFIRMLLRGDGLHGWVVYSTLDSEWQVHRPLHQAAP